MRERSTKYAIGAGRSAVLEAGRGGTWLRPLLVVLAAIALALAAALMVRPGLAFAAPSPLTDDTTADFEAGTPDANTRVGDGEVTLKPTVEVDEDFSGTALPSGWSVTQTWNPGGSATVDNSELTLDGVQVQSDAAFGPGRALEFAATYREGTFQNIGFTTSFAGEANDTWAAFGEGNTAGQLLARVKLSGSNTFLDTPVGTPGQYIGTEHVYRIEWAADEIRFYVDGNLVHTQTSTIANDMRVSASDFPLGGNNPSVDYFRVFSYPASGQFTSRVLEADGTADWQQLTSTVEPSGADVTFETRSGGTVTPDASWSDWQPVAPGGAIASPDGTYIQYRATLNNEDQSADGPAVEQVAISYELVDETSPTITPKKPKGEIRDRTPKIIAVVRDDQTELSESDIQLFVDGRSRDFSYDAETDKLVHKSKRLSYGKHTVRIEATDGTNETSKGWRFQIVKKR